MFPSHLFKNKHVLVGITGGIAAYKITELIRYLVTEGAEIRVVMSRAAEKFISSLTMETLSNNPVVSELFPEKSYLLIGQKQQLWHLLLIILSASFMLVLPTI
jgi:phosphopantothenoylcysteine decarboxylase/phosphopantothenate--cysteine ligase